VDTAQQILGNEKLQESFDAFFTNPGPLRQAKPYVNVRIFTKKHFKFVDLKPGHGIYCTRFVLVNNASI